MTKKETIYNALGMIEGAVCVSQKNTRDVLMKAIDMIRNAIEEKTECAESKTYAECQYGHKWELTESWDYVPETRRCGRFVCEYCGKCEIRDI